MRFLSISLGDEVMGIELEHVREVIAFPEISPMPGMPNFCLGIINLRSQVIPIIDLRIKLQIVPTLTEDTVIVVCHVLGKTVGFVVGAIHSVITPSDSEMLKLNENQESPSKLIQKVVNLNNKLHLILDINNVMGASESDIKAFDSVMNKLKSAA